MVGLEITDGCAILSLARPTAGNALDVATCEAFEARVGRIADQPGIRAVLLRAEGKNFCVGGDVSMMGGVGVDRAALLQAMVGPLHRGMAMLAKLDAPLVASVRGAAAGAGLSLVAAADLVVASSTAKFVMAYTGIGLTADGGATWTLPRAIGARRTLELALTNRRLSADEALAWGLVSQVVEDDDLDETASSLARRLAAGPTRAFGHVKRLVTRSLSTDFADQLEAESEAMAASAVSPDSAEGIGAFLQRRSPVFTGR